MSQFAAKTTSGFLCSMSNPTGVQKLRILRYAKGQGERGAATDVALDRQVTAHAARKILGNREAEADACMRSREVLIDLNEWLEDALDLICSNSLARVAHMQSDAFCLTCHIRCVDRARDIDATKYPITGLRELDRVRNEVQQDLLELLAVCPYN